MKTIVFFSGRTKAQTLQGLLSTFKQNFYKMIFALFKEEKEQFIFRYSEHYFTNFSGAERNKNLLNYLFFCETAFEYVLIATIESI